MAHMYAVFIDKYVHIGQAKCARRRQIAPFISPTPVTCACTCTWSLWVGIFGLIAGVLPTCCVRRML